MRSEHLQAMRGGKTHPLWAGVLDEAHAKGLKSLSVTVIQAPTPENGHLAIVSARAEFEDGQVFEDVGDASPGSCPALMHPHLLRLASTRAKGRCLRDATNIGEAILEELGEGDSPAASETWQNAASPRPVPGEPQAVMACQYANCGLVLDGSERHRWQARAN